MSNNDDKWYKLDNAANIFPAVSTVSATNVFRFSARLFEDVSEDCLQKAVLLALDETPSFRVKIRKGFFWYYFDQNNETPKVKPEYNYPCRRLEKYNNNGFLFEITYCGKYIHSEFFHALCDGTGAVNFLSKIVTKYITITHPDIITDVIESIDSGVSKSAQSEDSFIRVTRRKTTKGKTIIKSSSYLPSSTLNQNGEINVIKGIMNVDSVKKLTKEKGVTITELFASILIYSIYMEGYRFEPKNKSIVISIPVNLRKYFPSDTIRNFFTTVNVGVNFYNNNYSFDEVLEIVKNNFREELKIDNLYSKILYTVSKQKHIILRFIPLFLKNIILKLIYMKGEKGFTAAFSNIGFFMLPNEIAPFVDRFESSMSPTPTSHYKTSACSFGNKMVYGFTTNIENTEVQRRFFTMLQDMGIEVIISSNNGTRYDTQKEVIKKNEVL